MESIETSERNVTSDTLLAGLGYQTQGKSKVLIDSIDIQDFLITIEALIPGDK